MTIAGEKRIRGDLKGILFHLIIAYREALGREEGVRIGVLLAYHLTRSRVVLDESLEGCSVTEGKFSGLLLPRIADSLRVLYAPRATGSPHPVAYLYLTFSRADTVPLKNPS